MQFLFHSDAAIDTAFMSAIDVEMMQTGVSLRMCCLGAFIGIWLSLCCLMSRLTPNAHDGLSVISYLYADVNCYAGGGLWMPDAAPVAALRRSIDRHPDRIKTVLMDKNIRKEFLEGSAKKEAKAVAAFVSANSGNALKTKPKVRTVILVHRVDGLRRVVANLPSCCALQRPASSS